MSSSSVDAEGVQSAAAQVRQAAGDLTPLSLPEANDAVVDSAVAEFGQVCGWSVGEASASHVGDGLAHGAGPLTGDATDGAVHTAESAWPDATNPKVWVGSLW